MTVDGRAGIGREQQGEIASLNTQFEIFLFLKKVAGLFGFTTFMKLRLPGEEPQALTDLSVMNNWPAPMLAAYDEAGATAFCPVLRRLMTSTAPFQFTVPEEVTGVHPGIPPLAETFRAHGMSSGACFPVHCRFGGRAALMFQGDRPPLDATELFELAMISMHVFERYSKLRMMEAEKNRPVLTERERECLTWTAAGKTSADIAVILSLSEHTVTHYLNRAARKLKTSNRTQAVAAAMRHGWID